MSATVTTKGLARTATGQQRRSAATLLLCWATILWSPTALSWGAMGHELAAELARPYLSQASKHALNELLGLQSLADAATWADRMRSNPSRFWQYDANAYHYVTVPPGHRYADVGPPAQGDAITALRQFSAELRDPTVTLERKQLALRFAIHIVQDLQQPLHVGNSQDRGGNEVLVSINGQTSNLHRVWDRQIFDHTQRNRQDWLTYFKHSGLLRPPEKHDSQPQTWIEESASLRDSLYPAPAVIGKDYLRKELPRAERQLALAGIRTAAWLNTLFDDGTPTRDVPGARSPAQGENMQPAKAASPWQRLCKKLKAYWPNNS